MTLANLGDSLQLNNEKLSSPGFDKRLNKCEKVVTQMRNLIRIFMSTPLFLLFRRPPSGVRTLGFRSFEGKVVILSLPNLVWVFIGLIACMGLLLVKIGL